MDGGGSARTLEEALARMSWSLEPGSFALVAHAGGPEAADLDALDPPAQLVVEERETTLLVREEALVSVLRRHPAARVERGLAWIRFEAAMGWEVVGFLALVTGRLAAAGVPIGAVCSFDRDHLFVARAHLETVRAALDGLFPDGGGSR